jgi:hypothetical protein
MIDLTKSPPAHKQSASPKDIRIFTIDDHEDARSDINMSSPSFDMSMKEDMPSPIHPSIRSTPPVQSPLSNPQFLRRVKFAPLVEERRMSPVRARPPPDARLEEDHTRAQLIWPTGRSPNLAQNGLVDNNGHEAGTIEMKEIAKV